MMARVAIRVRTVVLRLSKLSRWPFSKIVNGGIIALGLAADLMQPLGPITLYGLGVFTALFFPSAALLSRHWNVASAESSLAAKRWARATLSSTVGILTFGILGAANILSGDPRGVTVASVEQVASLQDRLFGIEERLQELGGIITEHYAFSPEIQLGTFEVSAPAAHIWISSHEQVAAELEFSTDGSAWMLAKEVPWIISESRLYNDTWIDVSIVWREAPAVIWINVCKGGLDKLCEQRTLQLDFRSKIVGQAKDAILDSSLTHLNVGIEGSSLYSIAFSSYAEGIRRAMWSLNAKGDRTVFFENPYDVDDYRSGQLPPPLGYAVALPKTDRVFLDIEFIDGSALNGIEIRAN